MGQIVLVLAVLTLLGQRPPPPARPLTRLDPQISVAGLTNGQLVQKWLEEKRKLKRLLPEKRTKGAIEQARSLDVEVFRRIALKLEAHLGALDQDGQKQFTTGQHPEMTINGLTIPAGQSGPIQLLVRSTDFRPYLANLFDSEELFFLGWLEDAKSHELVGVMITREYPEVGCEYRLIWGNVTRPRQEVMLLYWAGDRPPARAPTGLTAKGVPPNRLTSASARALPARAVL